MTTKFITDSNEFFDAELHPKTVGFFEELYDVDYNKGYGIRMIEGLPTRKMGNSARVKVTFTEPFTVLRSGKSVTIKASKEAPRVCWSAIHVLGGR